MVHLSLMLFAGNCGPYLNYTDTTDSLPTLGSLFTKSLAVSSSGFVASDESVSFALNIPEANGSNDLYFTLSGPASSSWIVSLSSISLRAPRLIQHRPSEWGTMRWK